MFSYSNMNSSIHDDYVMQAQLEVGWVHVEIMQLFVRDRYVTSREYWVTRSPKHEVLVGKDLYALGVSVRLVPISDQSSP